MIQYSVQLYRRLLFSILLMNYLKEEFEMRSVSNTPLVGNFSIFLAVLFVVIFVNNAESAERKFADLPGVRLAYFDTGGPGEAVVFMHASAGSSEAWAPQLKSFAQAGYRAIAYDRRGFGKSVTMPKTGAQPGTSTNDLDNFVKHLGLGKFHLVGTAGGGNVAVDYASLHQDKLASLTLSAIIGEFPPKFPELKSFWDSTRNPDVEWPSVFLEVGLTYMGSNPEGLAKWKHISENARQKGAPRQPQDSPNTVAKFKLIKIPTMVIAGGADQLSPPGLMRIWAVNIENHEYAVVPEAGHSISWEYPDEFDRIVFSFLRAHSPERKPGQASYRVIQRIIKIGGQDK
jgi:pimeloyl-ACP methyl ester carboxylesterase